MPKVTSEPNTQAKLRAAEERYQAFIHNSIEGIWRYELEKPVSITLPVEEQIDMMFKWGYLAETNDAMARMYGLEKAEQLVGSRLGDLLDRDVAQNIEYLKAFIASGYNLQGMESQETDAKGRTKYFLNSLVGIVRDGLAYGAWGTQLDVTKQHLVTAALQESEQRLNLALKASRLGMWEWDITTGDLSWSDELRKIFDVPAKKKVTYELYISRIHQDDRKLIQDTVERAMEADITYEIEHRIVWQDGTIHWVLSRGRAIHEKGVPVRILGTCMNINERKAAEELKVKNALLSAERKELVRLNKSKDDFIALASHQLRTPATSVKQYLGMLLEGYAGELGLSGKQLQLLQTAYDSNERQIGIVNNLLLIATIDAGKIKLQKQAIEVIAFIGQIVEDYSHKYAAKNQALQFKHPKGEIVASFDDEKLRMAIENLLDNASKYSQAGTETTVTVTRLTDGFSVAVKDRGVGIDKKDFEKLFQKFSRIPNALSTSSGGSGLGLYWAQKIIELHGGTLDVESASGKGTTFAITLSH